MSSELTRWKIKDLRKKIKSPKTSSKEPLLTLLQVMLLQGSDLKLGNCALQLI
jgi:hypothetical protein